MEESKNHYSIEELAELVDLPVRTIRYYISEGLMPGPGARGKAAMYGEEHLLRLRLIRLLSRQYVPLVEMRARLAALSLEEMRALLVKEEQHAAHLEQTQPLPAEGYIGSLLKKARTEQQGMSSIAPIYAPGQGEKRKIAESPPAPRIEGVPIAEAEQWLRWELVPGIELHVRAASESQHQSLLERLFQVVGKRYSSANKRTY